MCLERDFVVGFAVGFADGFADGLAVGYFARLSACFVYVFRTGILRRVSTSMLAM